MKATNYICIILLLSTISSLESKDRSQQCDKTRVIEQRDLPLTIEKSGIYCFGCNLEYNGDDTAISILSDNVTILGNERTLTLSSQSARGIAATNVAGISIKNVSVRLNDEPSVSEESAAIYLNGVRHAVVEDAQLSNTAYGLLVTSGQDVTASQLYGTDNYLAFCKISLTDSMILSHSYCEGPTLPETGLGVQVDEQSANLRLLGNQMKNRSIFLKEVDGFLVENNEVVILAPEKGSISIQFGNFSDVVFSAQNGIVKNNTFNLLNAAGDDSVIHINVVIAQTNALQFINNSVLTTSTSQDALSVGCAINTLATEPYRATLIKGNIFAGNSSIGLGIGAGNFRDFTITENIISGASAINMELKNNSNFVIQGNSIHSSGGLGVDVAAADNLTFCENVISGNASIGLQLANGTENNLIQANKVFGNGNGGIVDNGMNVVQDNIEFNNGGPIIETTKELAKEENSSWFSNLFDTVIN